MTGLARSVGSSGNRRWGALSADNSDSMTKITQGSSALINEYLTWMRVRGLSPQTMRTARYILTGLALRLGPVPLAEATPQHLAQWQAARAQELVMRSLRAQTGYVKAFYAWALDWEVVAVDPARRLLPPRTPRLLPRPIAEDALLDALDNAGPRMRAILGLAAFAGLRACEIARLAWSDVVLDGPERQLRVVGKGSRERVVPVSDELAGILRALPGTHRGPVIRRGDGTPGHNSPNAVSKAALRHLRACDHADTLHALRHRLITWACRHGGIRRAQEIAGHASPATTAGYAAVAGGELREVIEEAGKIQRRPKAS
jgi:integrase/recombinase XerC